MTQAVDHTTIYASEIALTPDINACLNRVKLFTFPYPPNSILMRWRNMAGQGVLAPQVAIGFSDVFVPDEGVFYRFNDLHQKYRSEAARLNMTFADFIYKNWDEARKYKFWAQSAGLVEDMVLEIWYG
jgi:hypothetical protein